MTSAEANKRLRGRRIVKVLLRPFNDELRGTVTDPLIVLDDGTTLSFLTQETDVGEYGVKLIISDKQTSDIGEKDR